MQPKIKYQFRSKLHQDSSKGAWHFISVPKHLSSEIRTQFGWQEEGWGRLKAKAQIGNSILETAIWFDSKAQVYLLPVKAIIRKQENLQNNDEISVIIWV